MTQPQLFSEINNAKPFLKWAGGKTQLLEQIRRNLPDELQNGKITRYVEPFVGGGAVFFYLSQMFSDLKDFVIADVNYELILLYKVIQNEIEKLILELQTISNTYLPLDNKRREEYFYDIRDTFNNNLSSIDFMQFHENWVLRAAQIIFLNRTCFNGLFRVNSKGKFNVPFGKYDNPTILDERNLKAASSLLKNTNIILGDFSSIEHYVDDSTFVYFDPPYRPISKTASFNSYAKNVFNDQDQLRLADFYRKLDKKGAKLLLSNSDPTNINGGITKIV